jgi:hypothetical protein
MAETACRDPAKILKINVSGFKKFYEIHPNKKTFIKLPVICYYFSDISAAQYKISIVAFHNNNFFPLLTVDLRKLERAFFL